jgi:hypothetical protein
MGIDRILWRLEGEGNSLIEGKQPLSERLQFFQKRPESTLDRADIWV